MNLGRRRAAKNTMPMIAFENDITLPLPVMWRSHLRKRKRRMSSMHWRLMFLETRQAAGKCVQNVSFIKTDLAVVIAS